jgi:ELWxxDGT repeat protein
MIESGGLCYFRAYTPLHGEELWRSDGTAAGTTLVKDLNPGAASSSPHSLKQIGSRGFCFSAIYKNQGSELWVSDGSSQNTFRTAEIYPGVGSAQPAYFEFAGGGMFFSAEDGVHGRELWRLDVGATAQSYGRTCGPGVPTLTATDPVLGQNMTFVGENAPAGGYTGLLMIGAPVLPLSALGCSNIYYSAFSNYVQLHAFTSTTSRWSFQLAIPNNVALLGQVVTAQAPYLWIPNGLQNLRLTNGVRLTVGR